MKLKPRTRAASKEMVVTREKVGKEIVQNVTGPDRQVRIREEPIYRHLERLYEMSNQAKLLSVALEGLVNGIHAELQLPSRRGGKMSSSDADILLSAQTPFGFATVAPPAGVLPRPKDGKKFTAEELGNVAIFTRPVLEAVYSALGGDTAVKFTPPDLRSGILEIQGGAVKALGTCDITGDGDVVLSDLEVDGDVYCVGPKVRKHLEQAKTEKEKMRLARKIVALEVEVT